MKSLYIAICTLLLFSCSFNQHKNWEKEAINPDCIHRSLKEVTDVIVHDIFSPPVASRIYAYTTIAGYEAAIHDNPSYNSLAGQLNDLKALPQPEKDKKYCFPLASTHAMLMVGKALVFSEDKIEAFHGKMMKEFKDKGIDEDVFENSIAYGKQVADHILAWSAEDNYKQTRSFPKYSITDDPANWKPTPPAYMDAIEPHWNKIRTFLIDSAKQFAPLPPTLFSLEKNSQFFKEAMEVYEVGKTLTEEQKEIANFWDCNPFKMNVTGHVMYATKKISPGGHWINITRLACKKSNADVVESLEAYTSLSIALADGFISCWDEKFRSKVIRPETYINQHIDENWVPFLQTPPFPEYTSGHSVISNASSVILTKLFGENFAYDDSTEVEFNIPVRKFKSFKEAAEEAAISRFYGGIHYMPSITNGLKEGNELGVFVVGKLKMRKENLANAE